MKKYVQKFLIATAFGIVTASAATDSVALCRTVNLEVTAEKARVVEIVTKYAAAAPEYASEVVKTAIKASDADEKTVAAIVEAAIKASAADKKAVDAIVKAAIATAPDAASDIQAVIARLDPNSGETAVAEGRFNPLDFPGDETSTVDPRTGDGDPRSDTPPIINTPEPGPYQQPTT